MLDAWDLHDDVAEQGGKARAIDSLSQSQHGCESQVPLRLIGEAGFYHSPGVWSVGQQGQQAEPAGQQPPLLSRQQPDNAQFGWSQPSVPGAQQPASGRSLLGRPAPDACTSAADPNHPAAVLHGLQGGGVQHPQCRQPMPQPAAPTQPAAEPPVHVRLGAPVSNMCLETYCHIHSLLTGGRSTVVQQLHAPQLSTLRSQDIKQVLYMHGHAVGSKTKQDLLDKMVGLPLSSMQRRAEAAKVSQATGHCAAVDTDDLVALGLAAPTGLLKFALQRNELRCSMMESSATGSKEANTQCVTAPDHAPQRETGAVNGRTGDLQLPPAAPLQHRAMCEVASATDVDTARKRKAAAWLSDDAADQASCRHMTHNSSMAECTVRYSPGSVVWVTMGKKKWPALVITVDNTQAGRQPVDVRVQLFATGIKTTVKLSTDCQFKSSDTPADDSALAHKAFAAAQMHFNSISVEE